MAFLSKKKLSKPVETGIKRELFRLFTLTGQGTSRSILEELLTDTEILMLAKRLATLMMLERDFSYYRIQQTLGVSVSTCKRLHQKLFAGDYATLQKIFVSRASRKACLITIETILRAGLPPRGKGRWKRVYELLEK